ncbi:glutamate synthase large subunit [Salinicoccus hispanicus]|uniref:Glutamate synthase large subunit n=1 Tax=Salinicoccus hispanicus TaxID=157225 RepID=A0A6N8U2L7_9STAP|nr:glutamate synthase large subunit [Salinicoccus hispanicus]MXQ51226.1 glutamate synthase large subunit [Salinicoccus hispanicus]
MSLYQPIKQKGLYHHMDEHDACGIGFYANMDNIRSHGIVIKSLEMLERLDHRGGVGNDGVTGDGAGIMTEIPHALLQEELQGLPEFGQYSVGMYLIDTEASLETFKKVVEETVAAEGQHVIAFRPLPVNDDVLADNVRETVPQFMQVVTDCHTALDLYYMRKMIEQNLEAADVGHYVASFSSETIVYKGWLRAGQIKQFYLDLNDSRYVSKFGSVHSRFSTNTFPSWARAHPNRLLMHNGEINTIKGNMNWMKARTKQWLVDTFGEKGRKIEAIIDESGSDSAIVDNVMEFMSLTMSPEQAAMIMIPEPWKYQDYDNPAVKDFYEFYSYLMEPWDGPTMISFCDNHKLGALTDRNGLRPGRYYVTKSNEIIYSSEVGVVDVEESAVLYKGQLSPGKLLLVDFDQSKIIENDELKHNIATQKPYSQWMSQKRSEYVEPAPFKREPIDKDVLHEVLVRFGYTKEDIEKYMKPLTREVKDPIGAMGFDQPLAFLSNHSKLLFDYFKQHFAQVTNPPLDSYREKIVTSEITYLGKEGRLLTPGVKAVDRVQLERPVIDQRVMDREDVKRLGVIEIDTTYTGSLKDALSSIRYQAAEQAKKHGVIVLTDERILDEPGRYAIPSLLATSAVHQALISGECRTKTSIVVRTAEVREVHHVATLIGFGANAVHPYIAQETLVSVSGGDTTAVSAYNKALTEGLIKVMAKMGISTVQSYHGAQVFEAVGLGKSVMHDYFGDAPSKIGGLSIEDIDYRNKQMQDRRLEHLESGSRFQWRQQGEDHVINPNSIRLLQVACRTNDQEAYEEYKTYMHGSQNSSIRHLLKFKSRRPIDIDQVESKEKIVKRFKTGAMSFGSLSQEAHETLAEAMNQIGGRSNSGEGGEHRERFAPKEDGRNLNSAIKQVASGRFGVNSEYLNSAKEIQIKVAQGAKPGEGGQLPGQKVYPWVAEIRNSTPGVGLISPPPHHDIYSIEDLAQLIHDLKNANKDADISVKLVAKGGVGTIAAGVAKAYADKIVISGFDGGTGASPLTSIQHAGLPWELGLTEAHQTLQLNGLRSRVTLETDGKLMTGRDVAIACALGAEEFAFATAPLVVLGCIMMRVCHKDTCPVGIATQNGDLRKLYTGKAEHVVNFMHFIAEDIREILAELGLKSMDDLVGAVEHLEVDTEKTANHHLGELDLAPLLTPIDGARRKVDVQKHPFEWSLDDLNLLPDFEKKVEAGEPHEAAYHVRNRHRNIGTQLGSLITKKQGMTTLDTGTYKVNTFGHAGQSYGAFIPKGLTMHHIGDLNDYVGKGISGGRIIVEAPVAERSHDIIVGNVCLYGAIDGQVFINGVAGERFGVRNSGAEVVVEGIGDHGLEYMTGGRVVIIGSIGKNFAAGMSGGIAYIINEKSVIENQVNMNHEMIEVGLVEDVEELASVMHMLYDHQDFTNSGRASDAIRKIEAGELEIIKVIPVEYRKMQQKIRYGLENAHSLAEAELKAFNGELVFEDKELDKMNIF